MSGGHSTGSSPSPVGSDDELMQDPIFKQFQAFTKDLKEEEKKKKKENGILNNGQPSTSGNGFSDTIISVPTTSNGKIKMDFMDMIHPADLPENHNWMSYMFIKPSIDDNPGRFLWIWFMGHKCPSIVINGEAYLPVELLDEGCIDDSSTDGKVISTFLRDQKVQTRYANRIQFYTIMKRCERSRKLGVTGLSLVARSQLERVMGGNREISQRTTCEHEEWDDKQRVHVIHVNFIDLYDEWLEGDDKDEDPNEYGVHGYWYKNRRNMRSIKCVECLNPFTPADFVLHHHYPRQYSTTEHHGLNSSKWSDMIQIHRDDRNEQNLTAWRRYCCGSTSFGKRTYDEAGQAPLSPKRPFVEDTIIVDDEDEPMEICYEGDGEEIPFKYETYDEMIESGRTLTVADYLGPRGLKGIVPKNLKEKLILDVLCMLDQKSLEILLLSKEEEVEAWFRDHEFIKKVMWQQDRFDKLRKKDPGYDRWAGASFDPKTGKFENIRQLENATKATKKEIEILSEEMRRLQTEAKSFTYLEYLKKEQKLLKNCSKEVIRLIANIPPLPKLILPPLPPIPMINPLLLSNLNISELAKKLAAAGIKLPLPNLPMLPFPIPLPQIPLPNPSAPSTSKVPPTPTATIPQIPFPIVPIPIHKNSAPSLPVSKIVSPTLSAGPSTSSAGPSTSTPTTPVTPILPVLPTFPLPIMPISTNVELFSKLLGVCYQTNPAGLASLPPVTGAQPNAFDNVLNLLKTATVKN